MKKNIIATFLSEFLVLAAAILVYKFAAVKFNMDGFSEYALSRRVVSLLLPIFILGLGVGITRFIAYNSVEDDNQQGSYFVSGLIILGFVAAIFFLILAVLRNQFSSLLFGNYAYSYLIFPVSTMLFGFTLHSACYSYFRGRFEMFKANSLQVINMAFVPLLAFSFAATVADLLKITGLFSIAVSFYFLVFFILKNLKFSWINVWQHAKELLGYGIQRVPGDLGLAAFLALPAVFTTHISGIEEAGFMAFAISIVSMVAAMFNPIGLIILPQASQLIARGDYKKLKKYVSNMLKIAFLLTFAGIAIFETFADKILYLYLGNTSEKLILVTRIIFLGSLPYVIYVSMRNIIEAYYIKAVNSWNIIISLLVFIVISWVMAFGRGVYSVASVFVIAMYILGALTVWEIRKIFKSEPVIRNYGGFQNAESL